MKTMNIQAEKLELVRLILDTDNPTILSSIKRIFSNSKSPDFWDSLPENQKDEILKGIEEIENGETVDYEEYIKKHR
jgi:TRAP-type C4-dicarboxylate transport system substrate-binding protein